MMVTMIMTCTLAMSLVSLSNCHSPRFTSGVDEYTRLQRYRNQQRDWLPVGTGYEGRTARDVIGTWDARDARDARVTQTRHRSSPVTLQTRHPDLENISRLEMLLYSYLYGPNYSSSMSWFDINRIRRLYEVVRRFRIQRLNTLRPRQTRHELPRPRHLPKVPSTTTLAPIFNNPLKTSATTTTSSLPPILFRSAVKKPDLREALIDNTRQPSHFQTVGFQGNENREILMNAQETDVSTHRTGSSQMQVGNKPMASILSNVVSTSTQPTETRASTISRFGTRSIHSLSNEHSRRIESVFRVKSTTLPRFVSTTSAPSIDHRGNGHLLALQSNIASVSVLNHGSVRPSPFLSTGSQPSVSPFTFPNHGSNPSTTQQPTLNHGRTPTNTPLPNASNRQSVRVKVTLGKRQTPAVSVSSSTVIPTFIGTNVIRRRVIVRLDGSNKANSGSILEPVRSRQLNREETIRNRQHNSDHLTHTPVLTTRISDHTAQVTDHTTQNLDQTIHTADHNTTPVFDLTAARVAIGGSTSTVAPEVTATRSRPVIPFGSNFDNEGVGSNLEEPAPKLDLVKWPFMAGRMKQLRERLNG